MPRILLTGFTPFDGREVNGSWITARALRDQMDDGDALALEIPVIWGAPEVALSDAVKDFKPDLVLSFGEGKPGAFQFETLALNRRALKKDIAGNYPPQEEIIAGGPLCVTSHALLRRVREEIFKRNIPAVLSLDAGGYLCEETLFLLEYLIKDRMGVGHAFFIHVPPYGTPLRFRHQERLCDAELLAEFARHFYEILAVQVNLSGVPDQSRS